MPIYNFKCSVCGSEVNQYILSPVGLSGGEKHHLTCCGLVREKTSPDEVVPEFTGDSSVLIKGAYHKEKTQKMLVERAKKYEKQEKEHKASVIRNKVFGM